MNNCGNGGCSGGFKAADARMEMGAEPVGRGTQFAWLTANPDLAALSETTGQVEGAEIV